MSDNPIFFVNESIKIQQPSEIVQETHAAETEREPADKPPALVSELFFADQAKRASVIQNPTPGEEEEAQAAAALLLATQFGGCGISGLERGETRNKKDEEEESKKKPKEKEELPDFGD